LPSNSPQHNFSISRDSGRTPYLCTKFKYKLINKEKTKKNYIQKKRA